MNPRTLALLAVLLLASRDGSSGEGGTLDSWERAAKKLEHDAERRKECLDLGDAALGEAGAEVSLELIGPDFVSPTSESTALLTVSNAGTSVLRFPVPGSLDLSPIYLQGECVNGWYPTGEIDERNSSLGVVVAFLDRETLQFVTHVVLPRDKEYTLELPLRRLFELSTVPASYSRRGPCHLALVAQLQILVGEEADLGDETVCVSRDVSFRIGAADGF
jgi:hypothetical protein